MTTKLKKPPEWARWVAIDKDRQVWAYEDKPYIGGAAWITAKRSLWLGEGVDWRESLRPVNTAKTKPKRRKGKT